MKNFKLALLPAAVAGILASGQAFAGTEACFEVYKQADGTAVAAHATLYTGANCIAEDLRTGAAADNLEATDESKIAYELTGDLDVDFDAIDTVDEDLQVVYIPTTDIPGGTLIEIQLSGATFKGNADIIHLVKDDTGIEAVASSDGAVDGQNTITFLTKAGTTIGAGTRLAFSKVSGAVTPVSINIQNTGCTDPTSASAVKIRATKATTDGGTGFNIAGGVSKEQLIADISPQYLTFWNTSATDGEVNAESSDYAGAPITARTQFVYDPASDKLIHKANQVITKSVFIDREAELDQAHTLTADDHLVSKFVATSDPSALVKAGIYDRQDAAGTGDLSNQIEVETGTAFGDIATELSAATAYDTEATDLFTDGVTIDTETKPAGVEALALYNETFYVVENTDGDNVMNFNYIHGINHELQFNDADLLDHCVADKALHNVGVNGAVLKVPYTYDTKNNWVRITNEHTESAEITLDIFDENSNVLNSIPVGTVAHKASVVLRANELIKMAKDAGYAGTGTRHTMTFTVTAPRDSVHGVSVQAIPGGVDRVMPVLDQNVWTQ